MHNIGSNFKEDLNTEQIFAKYLDGVYTKLGISFDRKHDKESQFDGIDVVFEKNGKDFIVDEKAQITYINQSLQTFAFEISHISRVRKKRTINTIKEGWLFDESKKTKFYLLAFDIKSNNGDKIKAVEDIIGCELVLLSRDKLIRYLGDKGIDKAFCKSQSKYIRWNNVSGRTKLPHNDSEYFVFSSSIPEQPINLVISRRKLRGLGKVIYKEG